jgi:hypothetical protein
MTNGDERRRTTMVQRTAAGDHRRAPVGSSTANSLREPGRDEEERWWLHYATCRILRWGISARRLHVERQHGRSTTSTASWAISAWVPNAGRGCKDSGKARQREGLLPRGGMEEPVLRWHQAAARRRVSREQPGAAAEEQRSERERAAERGSQWLK